MTDEYVSRAELDYRLNALKERVDGVDKRLDLKVPIDTWNLQNAHVATDMAELDRDCRERTDDIEKAATKRADAVEKAATERSDAVAKTAMDAIKEIKDGKQNAWVRVIGVLGIAATLAAAVWAAYLSSRGVH